MSLKKNIAAIIVYFSVLIWPLGATAQNFAVQITDVGGMVHNFSTAPQRVICLSPYITQILRALKQDRRIIALTRQDLRSHASLDVKNLGSYFNPELSDISQLKPDLVICPPGQLAAVQRSLSARVPVLVMKATSLKEGFSQIEDMGRLFDCQDQAIAWRRRITLQMNLVSQRLDSEKELQKVRVARVIGSGKSLSCPGDDSFQNEMIRAAGGIVPQWGKNGSWVQMDPKAWKKFNPQVVYGCNANADAVRELLATNDFKTVDAVKNGRVYMFPCELTCRVSTATGDFVQWLAAMLYPEVFADPDRAVTEDKELWRRPVPIEPDSLPYIADAEVIGHRVADTPYKSLVLRFKTPQTVLSTLNGLQTDLDGCGNTYIPMVASLGHMRTGVIKVQETCEKNLGFGKGKFTGLMTGANMDNLAVATKRFKDLSVTAFVTAGVRGNAMRFSKDQGYYISHGTINIIVAVNRKLSVAAMSRAIISATEGKTAALEDLDIRSTYTGWRNPATGTGTDNVLVIQGDGRDVAYAGGHSKIAELMAKAVHEGVTRAIAGQNGILPGRSVFQRLHERGLSLEALVRKFQTTMAFRPLVARLEQLMSDPWYASFLESALAVADAREKDLITDSPFWDQTCRKVTAAICGRELAPAPCTCDDIPPAVAKGLGALITGIESAKETSK